MKISLKYFIVIFIKIYQCTISLLLQDSCRFEPTCSNYAIKSIEKYGCFMGLFISVKRIVKCHPLYSNNSYDPVP